ncbi:MAG: bifunctional phosphoribosyl-AMP cyclohydrolase/phosphoribosyl-ATP diphosphatase HisIE [Pyrinomonadaceae bacterium]|nr:bifunctional phosphoribosyl-AMP cyclohydrolase/phosphoribosyl-ATP diphosphatase HisIE [Pyrinomonadaceae bacterium]MCX7640004.1 bifunctional phosphoribosyl-AMP cyclohydrolase/phosphoribosyl-ATP diphosphatase HisIE [Pyrinomonadaceae bacterium]MDW8304176.1 bifunctional phosphoribosyl-AMP cyclohydrolase/phosphoribosyl-ATP diphosphatase HisIE [Acidobacteriota bacterium]
MEVNFGKYSDGLVPVVVQDVETLQVLMLGFMNREAFEETRRTGKAVFYSRSRQKLWVKGETSGSFLLVREILIDCDSDTILLKVKSLGNVCHTGAETCFNEKSDLRKVLFELENLIRERREQMPSGSYTTKLFSGGINKIAQKFGEEAVELIIEAKDEDIERFKAEAADLVYHFLVLLAAKEVSLADVLQVLKERKRQ